MIEIRRRRVPRRVEGTPRYHRTSPLREVESAGRAGSGIGIIIGARPDLAAQLPARWRLRAGNPAPAGLRGALLRVRRRGQVERIHSTGSRDTCLRRERRVLLLPPETCTITKRDAIL